MTKRHPLSHAVGAHILAATMLVFAGGTAKSAPTEFVPPNDPDGMVFSTNRNDIWSGGRGIGFEVDSETSVSSVGVFHDLTDTDLAFRVQTISSLSGSFSRTSTLRNGSRNVTTNGLEWLDFGFSELSLSPGNNYLLEFSFSGRANQNFFYGNNNAAWNQSPFLNLEGTAGDGFGNLVVGAFRANAEVGEEVAVPAPPTLALFCLGLFFLGFVQRERRRLNVRSREFPWRSMKPVRV
jgi:hypothetical protein